MDVGQSNNRGKFPPLQLISLSIGSVVLLFYFNQLFTTASRRRTLSSKASKFNWVLSIPRTLFFLFLSFLQPALASRSFVLSWDELDKRPPAKVKVCHVVTEQNHIWKNPLKQNPIIHQQSFNNSLQSTCFVNIWIFREGSLQHIPQFFGSEIRI